LDATPWDILKTWSRTIPCQSHHPHGRRPSHQIFNKLYRTHMTGEKVPIYFEIVPSPSRNSLQLNGTLRGLGGTWAGNRACCFDYFQPEPIDLDFFNLNYFNLKPIGGAYLINKRRTRIYILFFRSFLKV
jgi:hypothetical protein